MVVEGGRFQRISAAAALVLILVAAPSLAPQVRAADFTVPNGATVGQQNLSDPGDTGLVEAGGTISTTANSEHAVTMSATDQDFDNSGSISTLGGTAYGVYGLFDDAEIFNNGSITTGGGTGVGIHVLGDDTVVVNSGSISTAGNFAFGVFAISNASITNSGSISTMGRTAEGIRAFGSGSTVLNSGSISTGGDDASGINSTAPNIESNNSGSISTAGESAYGIRTSGSLALVINSGMISTDGESAHSIASFGDGVTINNSDILVTTGDSAAGIYTDGINAEINNTGSVSTGGENSHSIASFADGVAINNSGSLSTTGATGHGIVSDGDDAEITNSGDILATGADARGVLSSGANGQVTNSGQIISLQSNAIEFSGAQDNTLTLLPGSVIQGGIVLGGGNDTLVIGNGLSIDITFDKLPEMIDAQGAPYVVSGTRVMTGALGTTETRVVSVNTADLAGLMSQGEQLADMTGGFSWLLEDRLSALRNTGRGNLLAGRGGAGAIYQTASLESLNDAGPSVGTGPDHPFWVQSFGSYRRHEAEGSQLGTAQWQHGLLAGADQLFFDGDFRAGAFVGTSWGFSRVLEGSQESETRGAIVGAYASLERQGLIFDFALSGGYNAIEQKRDVVNSQVSGGLETAEADYGGWFVSPEMRVTMPTTLFGQAAEPSLSLRYAGLFLDDYDEKSVAAPLSVEERDLHMGIARLQLALPDEMTFDNGDILRYRVKAGAELRRSFGEDRINAVLLNQSVSFESGYDEKTLSGFAGVSGEYDSGSGTVFFLSTEGQLGRGGTYQLAGQVGLKFSL